MRVFRSSLAAICGVGVSCAVILAPLAPLAPVASAATSAPSTSPSTTVAAGRLSVVLSAPSGVLDSVEQGSELRWLFDRPVVDLSSVATQPDPARFVEIVPTIAGSFRWVSTRSLTFTARKALPASTRFTATLIGLKALDGTTLAQPSVIRFETPRTSCKLHSTDGAWPSGGDDSYVVVTCDQPVDGRQLASLTTMRFSSVTLEVSNYTPANRDLAEMQKADPAGANGLAASLARSGGRSRGLGESLLKWVDSERCSEDGPICHRLEIVGTIPANANATLRLAAGLTSSEGPLGARAQTLSDELRTPANPLVSTVGCRVDCDPEASVDLSIDGDSVSMLAFDRKLRVRDLAGGRVATFIADRPKSRIVERTDADTGNKVLVTETDPIDPLRAEPLALLWAGLQPGRSYSIEIDPSVRGDRGLALGYRSITTLSLGNYSAFISLPSGERVLEQGKAAGLRVRSRNVSRIEQARRKVSKSDLVRTVLEFTARANGEVDEKGEPVPLRLNGFKRKPVFLATKVNTRSSVPIAVAENASSDRGVYVIAMRPIGYQPKSRYDGEGFPLPALEMNRSTSREPNDDWSTSLVQLTDLAVTIKQSPGNVLVAVTSLVDSQPAADASVELYAGTKKYWSGRTDSVGLAWAPPDPRTSCVVCNLVVVAQHKGDLAYAQSRWRDGYDEYSESSFFSKEDVQTGSSEFPVRFVASLFADRGVYKVGEQVHVKGLLRRDTAQGLRLPDFSEVIVTVTDARDVRVHKAKVKLTKQGGFESVFRVPADGAQGSYRVGVETTNGIGVGSTFFLVATFRRPEFKVDVAAAGRSEIRRGDTFEATAEGRYLFGATMAGRDVAWTLRSSRAFYDPAAVHPELGLDGYSWQYFCHQTEDCFYDEFADVASDDATLDAKGQLTVSKTIAPDKVRHRPQQYQLEAIVTDVNRQTIANRTSVLVHPGEFYTGVKLDRAFVAAGENLDAKAIALTPGGKPVAGVALTARLTRWDWVFAKRTTGDDSVQGDGEWRRTIVAAKKVVSGNKPVGVSFVTDRSGSYVLDVIAQDSKANRIESGADVYVTGDGFVPWDVPEEGTITLRAEKLSYAVGDRARVLVQSPWPTSDALVTVERGEVRTAERVKLTGSASVIEVPVRDEDVPNVYVSVTLFKGRTSPPLASQPDDPGRPQVRTGTVELDIPPVAKALRVSVTPLQKTARPATTVRAKVTVRDFNGAPAKRSEITLWAVDDGVLRLTDYRTPRLLEDLYPFKPLEVQTTDSRLRLLAISTDEKGLDAEFAAKQPAPGGGGGEEDASADGVRQDFRILALWKGALVADDNGEAEVAFTLPESLTTYRLLATASAGPDLFGAASSEIQVTKPFQVRPSLPRFFTPGDVVEAGAVLQNDTGASAQASLTVQVPAGSALRVEGPITQTLTLAPGATEVRFRFTADRTGTTAVTFDGRLGNERDAIRVSVPTLLPQRLEATAASGVIDANAAGARATQSLRLPAGVYPSAGGLSVGVSTSALAGLQNGVQDLVEYPYGCLEQRSSRLRVLLMISDLQGAFPLPQLAGAKLRETIDAELRKFSEFETSEGGLAYWPGESNVDVFLTARVLALLVDAEKLGVKVPTGMIDRVSDYLQTLVDDSSSGSRDESFASQIAFNRAHVLSALAHAGRIEKARIETLWEDRKDLPMLDQVHLLGAMGDAGIKGAKLATLFNELRNAVRIEADRAYVQEASLSDYCPCMAYLFADDVHDTAAMLSALLRVDKNDRLAPMMARWLLAQRRGGTWQNTLANGYALTALVDFYRAQEAAVPALDADVRVGSSTVVDRRFDGRSLETVVGAKTMAELLQSGASTSSAVPLTVSATGQGRLYYTARLRYAPQLRTLAAVDQGMTVERTYRKFADGSPATTSFEAGDLVRVTINVTTAQVRENVVIDDPLPAGLEALDVRLASTSQVETAGTGSEPFSGIDYTEIRDDRVLLFATSLRPGTVTYSYVARATSPGTYQVAPTHAQEMYRPEIFGRNSFTVLAVRVPGAATAPGASPAAAASTPTAGSAATLTSGVPASSSTTRPTPRG